MEGQGEVVEVRVLGPIALGAPDEGTRLGSAPLRALAALTANDATLSPSSLAEAVWAGQPPATASSALRVHVSKLRQVLGPDSIVTIDGGYRARHGLATDLCRWTALIERSGDGHARPDAIVATTSVALDLWRGEPWAEIEGIDAVDQRRAELVGQRLEVEDRLARACLDGGLGADHVDRLVRLAHSEPLREVRWAAAIDALHRAERQAEALRAYEEVRAVLADELGISPGALIQDAYDRAVTGSMTSQPTATPTGAVALIGRDDDVAAVERELQGARLVTITGVGGIGKTRLAREVHDRARRLGTATAWLGAPDDPSPRRRLRGLALQMGSRCPTESDALDVVTSRLAGVELLVLDGLDDGHDGVSEGIGEAVAWILRHRPRLRILATRRTPIGVSGERIHPLGPLTLSDDASAAHGSAVEMLAAVRGIVLDDADEVTLQALDADSRATSGIPLLLELSGRGASLTDVSVESHPVSASVRQLVADLDGALHRLATTAAVLPAGLTTSAAAAHLDHAPVERWLAFLTWSAVLSTEQVGRVVRHSMLDPVREAVLADLTVEQVECTWRCHAEHLGRQGTRLRPTWDEAPRYDVLRELDAEDGNLTTLLDEGRADRLTVIGQLATYLGCRGHAASALPWLRADIDSDDPEKAAHAALCAARVGRFSDAIVPLRADLDRAFAHFRAAGDDVWAAAVGVYATLAAAYRSGPVASREVVDEVALLRPRSSGWMVAMIDVAEGFVTLLEGRRDEALALLRGAEAAFAGTDPGGRALVAYLRAVFGLTAGEETASGVLGLAEDEASAAGDLPLIGLCHFTAIAGAPAGAARVRAARRAAASLDAGGLAGWAAQARLTAAHQVIETDDPALAVPDLLAALGPLRRTHPDLVPVVLDSLARGVEPTSSTLAGELEAAAVMASIGDATREEAVASTPRAAGIDDLIVRVTEHLELSTPG